MFSLGVLIVVAGCLLLAFKEEPSTVIPETELEPNALEEIPESSSHPRRDSEVDQNPMVTEGRVDTPNPGGGDVTTAREDVTTATPELKGAEDPNRYLPHKKSSGRVSLAPLSSAPKAPPLEVESKLPGSPGGK